MDANLDFFKNEVFSIEDDWNPDFCIYGGDWNIVLDQTLDTLNYLHDNNLQNRREVLENKNRLNLVDPWRDLNPSTKRYSWHQKGSTPKKNGTT